MDAPVPRFRTCRSPLDASSRTGTDADKPSTARPNRRDPAQAAARQCRGAGLMRTRRPLDSPAAVFQVAAKGVAGPGITP